MSTRPPQFIDVGLAGASRRIAVLDQPGRDPGLIWLSGFKSDMVSTKASDLAAHAADRGLAYTRFDYSGHGQSGGAFTDGTIGRWLEEALAVFDRTRGRQIVVGSSMGGYIALLLLRALQNRGPEAAARIGALVLVAPAWDMTEELMWREMPAAAREALERDGLWLRPSQYGAPYEITRHLIEEGRNHLLARRRWDPGCPVLILHGQQDPDVPWAHTLDLASFLDGDRVRITAVPDGEHRLSRPEDLARLRALVDDAVALAGG
jgi:pimeloyl-ACP methyl ester carboxylesterase